MVFELEVLAILLLATGQPAAIWDGTNPVEIEIRCDVISAAGVEVRNETAAVKVRPVQSPEDVQVDTQALPSVLPQSAARAVERSVAAREASGVDGARSLLNDEQAQIGSQPASPLVVDARTRLRTTRAGLEVKSESQLRPSCERYGTS